MSRDEETARSVLNGLGYTDINGIDGRALTDRFNHPEAATLTSSTLGVYITDIILCLQRGYFIWTR